MNEFITQHIEAIASVVTILGGMAAMFKYMLFSIHKDFDPKFEAIDTKFEAIDTKFEAMDKRFDNLEDEMKRFHTRLTWLDGYITHRDEDSRKHK